jgi:hypothetical protein
MSIAIAHRDTSITVMFDTLNYLRNRAVARIDNIDLESRAQPGRRNAAHARSHHICASMHAPMDEHDLRIFDCVRAQSRAAKL